MKTKSFNDYLKTRLSKHEIADIKAEAYDGIRGLYKITSITDMTKEEQERLYMFWRENEKCQRPMEQCKRTVTELIAPYKEEIENLKKNIHDLMITDSKELATIRNKLTEEKALNGDLSSKLYYSERTVENLKDKIQTLKETHQKEILALTQTIIDDRAALLNKKPLRKM